MLLICRQFLIIKIIKKGTLKKKNQLFKIKIKKIKKKYDIDIETLNLYK